MSDRLCTIRAGALPASCVLPILMESSSARGESKHWCVCGCVCSGGLGRGCQCGVGGCRETWLLQSPSPGSLSRAVTGDGGSWVGAQPGAGAPQDLWNSWLQLPVPISTPGAAHPAPASVSLSLSMSLLRGTGTPLLHTPRFWGTTVASQGWRVNCVLGSNPSGFHCQHQGMGWDGGVQCCRGVLGAWGVPAACVCCHGVLYLQAGVILCHRGGCCTSRCWHTCLCTCNTGVHP